MSKRHHATRRRTYGRRQHELHQRHELALSAAWGDIVAELRDGAFVPHRQDAVLAPQLRPDRDRQPSGQAFGEAD